MVRLELNPSQCAHAQGDWYPYSNDQDVIKSPLIEAPVTWIDGRAIWIDFL